MAAVGESHFAHHEAGVRGPMPFWTRFFNRHRKEQDFEEEIRAHLAIEVQQRIERGESPDEAHRRALKDFGNVGQVRESIRDVWGWSALDRLSQDFRYATRILLRQPNLTLVVVFSLALGIGANTLVFSLVNTLLLRSLPYPDPDRLMNVAFVPHDRPELNEFERRANVGNCLDLVERTTVFESIGCYVSSEGTLAEDDTGQPRPEWVWGEFYTLGAAQAIGVKPILGRWFTAAEGQPGGDGVVLISYGLWQSRFGGRSDVIGKRLRVHDVYDAPVPSTIIGVMPPGFTFATHWDNGRTAFWAPQKMRPQLRNNPDRYNSVVARLKPGISREQAQTELTALNKAFIEESPVLNKDWTMRAEPLSEALSGGLRRPFLLLEVAVACVLLIACANVAGLLLAQGSTQHRELALRAALGSTRWRIVRQLLVQCSVLACLGGLACLPLAGLGLRGVMAAFRSGVSFTDLPAGIRRLDEASLDSRVLFFTIGVSLATGLIFGVLPALKISKTDLMDVLKDSGRSATAGLFRQRLRSVFVVVQIALAFVLLVGAGLMTNSLLHLTAVRVGFNPKNVTAFSMIFGGDQYIRPTGKNTLSGSPEIEVNPRINLTTSQVIERVKAIPGVEMVTAMPGNEPLNEWARSYAFTVDGKPLPAQSSEQVRAEWYMVMPDYFHTLQIPILRGREFSSQDSADNAPVIIINATMAKRLWPNEDPIGKQIQVDYYNDKPRRIIGVVGEVRQNIREVEPKIQMYVPHAQIPRLETEENQAGTNYINFMVRSNRSLDELEPLIKAAAAEVDSSHAAATFEHLEQNAIDQTQGYRQYVALLGVLSGISVVLALVGMYGIMSHMISQRTIELGIRIALGATASQTFRLVLWKGLLVTGIGVLAGVTASLALTHLIRGALWGVAPTDPWTFAFASAVVFGVCFLACFFPARRTLAIDPVSALRHN
jgi:putative ABC transport system permease protein